MSSTVSTINGCTIDESTYGYFRQDGSTNGERRRLTKEEYYAKS